QGRGKPGEEPQRDLPRPHCVSQAGRVENARGAAGIDAKRPKIEKSKSRKRDETEDAPRTTWCAPSPGVRWMSRRTRVGDPGSNNSDLGVGAATLRRRAMRVRADFHRARQRR